MLLKESVMFCELPALTGRQKASNNTSDRNGVTSLPLHQTAKIIRLDFG
jgi:hypothetical protein